MFTAFSDTKFDIYSLTSLEKVFEYHVNRQRLEKIEAVTISDDQSLIAFISFNPGNGHCLNIYNLLENKYEITSQRLNTDLIEINYLKFSPDNSILLIYSKLTNQMVIYNLDEKRLIKNQTPQTTKIKFSLVERAFFNFDTGLIQKWSYDGQKIKEIITFNVEVPQLLSSIADFQILNDGSLLIVSNIMDRIIVSSFSQDLQFIKELFEFKENGYHRYYFSLDGKELVIRSTDNLIQIYDLETWQGQTYDLDSYQTSRVSRLAFDELEMVTRDYLILHAQGSLKYSFCSRKYNQIQGVKFPPGDKLLFFEASEKELLIIKALKQLPAIFTLQTLQRENPLSLAKDVVTQIIGAMLTTKPSVERQRLAEFLNDYSRRSPKSKLLDRKSLSLEMFKALKPIELTEIEVSEPWFSFLESGEKTVEGRKASKKWRELRIGQTIRFVGKSRSFLAKITAIRFYATLNDYLRAEMPKALPGKKTIEEGREVYLEFWKEKEIEDAGGVLGIEVERL